MLQYADDKPALTFKRGETKYQLVVIWEEDGQGREIVGAHHG